MNKMRVTCGTCAGFGKQVYWEVVGEDQCQQREAVCDKCDGKGYTEYAVFTPEEAEAILKHCGLPTEGDEVSEQ